MDAEMQEWFEENDGVASVSELAAMLDVDEHVVRRFARETGMRRVGSTYCFTESTAADLVADLEDGEVVGEVDDDDDLDGDGEEFDE